MAGSSSDEKLVMEREVLVLLVLLGLSALSPPLHFWLAARIVSKSGLSGAWALTQAIPIPLLGLLSIWAFAYALWPAERDHG
jgi:hypothetical protein